MAKGIQKVSSGWASWKWLSGIDAKQRMWFLGAVQGRQGFQGWMTHMVKGLQEPECQKDDPEFLLRFEAESDPWQRSKMVGQKISQLRKSFRELSNEQRAELAKTGEVEMMTGLQLLGKDKKLIQELVELVDPPAGHLAAHDNNETQDLHNLPPFFFYTICLHCRRFRINLLP